MATQRGNHDRSAAGMDFDPDTIREHAQRLGSTIAENGPEALFEEIESLLPESWRDHIRTFPLAAVLAGVGVGIFLGMKKSEEIITAGTSLISAAAMANVSSILNQVQGGDGGGRRR